MKQKPKKLRASERSRLRKKIKEQEVEIRRLRSMAVGSIVRQIRAEKRCSELTVSLEKVRQRAKPSGNLFEVCAQLQSIGRLISFTGVPEPYPQPANQCVAIAPTDQDAAMVVRTLKAVAIAYAKWMVDKGSNENAVVL